MILHIARKDFLTNLLSPRFVIGFILCLVLIPFSILVSLDNYRGRAAQYRIDHDAADRSAREVRVYSALRPEVVIPPEPLSVFSKGISGQLGNRVKVQLGDIPMLASGKTAAGDNPFLASFLSVDFVDVAAIIFSLLALIFSYDAFTREKEDGTLKLQMSNSLSRSASLAGKVLGVLFTLLPILVFSFLLSAVLILLSRNVAFSAVEWGRIVLLFATSLLYLAVFVFLGLLVSARSRSSVTSLVTCLFSWVFFVFLVPNISANFAESFVRVQSRDNLDRVLADLDRELEETIHSAWKAQGLSVGYSCWWCSINSDGYVETYGNDLEGFEAFRRKSEISEPIRIRYADRRWALQQSYLDSLTRQARAAETLSLLSPSGVFRTIASSVCTTDLRSHKARMDRVRRYRETFIRFLEAKDVFGSFSWVTPAPPESFRTEDQLVELRTGGEFKTADELSRWASKQPNPMAYWRKLSEVKVRGDGPQDFPYIDISDMPRFPDQPLRLFAGLSSSILNIGVLLVEAVMLFYLAFVGFIRFDVR